MIPNHPLATKILQLGADDHVAFDAVALDVFYEQARHNPLYAQYLSLIGICPDDVTAVADIPYLPIPFFKNRDIRTGKWVAERYFESSGTSGDATSRHALYSADWYAQIARLGFRACYGFGPEHFCWLGLLPSYLERQNSSLVAMTDDFTRLSNYRELCGFFLDDTVALVQRIKELEQKQIPTILIGVSFALLDLAALGADLGHVIVIETGGMKGRRRELTREELHEQLCSGLQTPQIGSEYGMTELTSQGYAHRAGVFRAAPTMRVSTRQITDPLAPERIGRTGALNIIDLGNLFTCAFVGTDDLGRTHADGTFEVLGRLDNSEIRGCNLMVM